MSRKGICKVCHQLRWISSRKEICRPCGYSYGACSNCYNERKIYVNGLCYMCYQDKKVRTAIDEIEAAFNPDSDYNKHIFNLYLTYIRRYKLQYFHMKQASELSKILTEISLEKILKWEDVYTLHSKYKLFQARKRGSAFLKVGYMLQELGVLPPRSEEFSHRIKRQLAAFDSESMKIIVPYIHMYKTSKRSDSTIMDHIYSLKNFISWCEDNNDRFVFLSVNENTIKAHLIFLHSNKHNLKYIRDALGHIKCFYRYCKYKKLILVDPAKNIRLSREPGRLCVCSEDHIHRLFTYIKNPNSDPECAMLISLILIWGLINEDLVHAKLAVNSNTLSIILRQKRLTKGKRYYNREQVLTLPQKPTWFYDLQKRFYIHWLKKYEKTKKSFPNYSLLLPYHKNYNRPLSKGTITKRVCRATFAATGLSIPPKILKQTCGFIHSRQGDASILSTLGWSQGFSFAYTCLPITYFKEKY